MVSAAPILNILIMKNMIIHYDYPECTAKRIDVKNKDVTVFQKIKRTYSSNARVTLFYYDHKNEFHNKVLQCLVNDTYISSVFFRGYMYFETDNHLGPWSSNIQHKVEELKGLSHYEIGQKIDKEYDHNNYEWPSNPSIEQMLFTFPNGLRITNESRNIENIDKIIAAYERTFSTLDKIRVRATLRKSRDTITSGEIDKNDLVNIILEYKKKYADAIIEIF